MIDMMISVFSREAPAMKPRNGSAIVAALLFGTLAASPSTAARLQGHLEPCGQRMCPWYESKVEAPEGWEKADDWTRRYKAVFMFPGGDQSKELPVMYVRAHQGEPELVLEEYIKVAQDKWKEKVGGAEITPLDDVAREGKPTFKVYFYRNPTSDDQGYELTAFMKDTSPDYKDATFFFQIVLSSPSQAELDKAKAAFYEVLKGL